MSCGASCTAFVTDDHQLIVWPPNALAALSPADTGQGTGHHTARSPQQSNDDEKKNSTPARGTGRGDVSPGVQRLVSVDEMGQGDGEPGENLPPEGQLTPRTTHPSRPGARYMTQHLVIWNNAESVAVSSLAQAFVHEFRFSGQSQPGVVVLVYGGYARPLLFLGSQCLLSFDLSGSDVSRARMPKACSGMGTRSLMANLS